MSKLAGSGPNATHFSAIQFTARLQESSHLMQKHRRKGLSLPYVRFQLYLAAGRDSDAFHIVNPRFGVEFQGLSLVCHSNSKLLAIRHSTRYF